MMPARPPNPVRPLSSDLRAIYDLELRLGNALAAVAEPAGTECPFAVFMRDPLHFAAVAQQLALPATVEQWKCDDPHYDAEEGFWCAKTRHAIVGPVDGAGDLAGERRPS